MSPVTVSTIGSYIREQREQAKISMRQLAQAAGVSNPYLSQVERGLRRPSADILQQIAKGLRISAEALYVQAGILDDRPADTTVPDAIMTDPELTERQKQMLIEIYESFRKEVRATAEALAAEERAVEAAAATGADAAADADLTADAGLTADADLDLAADAVAEAEAFAEAGAAAGPAAGPNARWSARRTTGLTSPDWAAATSVADGGGMSALIAAAQQEGTLNVISLPPAWVNYGAIISEFSKTYGITVSPAEGIFNSQQEVDAVRQHEGSAAAPDVLDIGMSVALAHTDHFARYQVQTWSAIPADQKDPAGLWYQDYGGYMAIGYDSARFGTITSVSQLLERRFAAAVALGGVPRTSRFALNDAGLNGVMMVNLAVGGTPDDIATGVAFFRELDAAGNFVPTQASSYEIMSGSTPVVLNWDYAISAAKLERARTDRVDDAFRIAAAELPDPTWDAASTWKVFVPPAAILGGFYAQAINKAAPHPAAARLWEEFLYSQDPTGGQNLWLAGGARPVQLEAMRLNGTLDPYLAHDLPPVTGTPIFLSQAQAAAAGAYLATNWARAVRSARR